MPEIEDETEERTFKKIIVSVEWLGTLSREIWGQVSVCVTTLVLWLNGLNYFTGVYTVKCSLAQWSWQVVKSPVGLFLARTLVCLSVPDRNIFIALARMDICMCSGCTFSSFLPRGWDFPGQLLESWALCCAFVRHSVCYFWAQAHDETVSRTLKPKSAAFVVLCASSAVLYSSCECADPWRFSFKHSLT